MSAENSETNVQEQPVLQREPVQLELDLFSDAPLASGYVCNEEVCESCQ